MYDSSGGRAVCVLEMLTSTCLLFLVPLAFFPPLCYSWTLIPCVQSVRMHL